MLLLASRPRPVGGYFPSVAAAWRVNDEAFLADNKVVSDLKLRLSYGQTGQQSIGSYYQHLSTYTASYDESRYLFGNKWYTTYRPNGYDPNIKWETTETYNIGIDYGFLNNRISGTIDYYWRNTKDLLNDIFVPAGSNFTNRIETNIGDMESKGLEIGVNLVPIQTKDWEWNISGNFTWNASKITKLNTIDNESNYVKTGNAGGTGRYLQVHMVGETPNTYYLLKQAYDENGQPLDGKYIAKDGSITLAKKTLTSTSLVRVPRPLTIAVCPPVCPTRIGIWASTDTVASVSMSITMWLLPTPWMHSMAATAFPATSCVLRSKTSLRKTASSPTISWREATSSV